MCDPLTLALAGGGLLLDQAQRRSVARKQKGVNTAEALRQQEKDRAAKQRVTTTTEVFDPEARAERFETDQADLEARLVAPVTDADNLTLAAGGLPGGRLSEDYVTAAAKEEAEALDRTLNIARLMSRIDAAGHQRFGEGVELTRGAEDLARIGQDSRGSAAAAGLELKEAGQGSPVLGTLAGVMRGAAAAGVNSGSFGPSVPGAPAPGSYAATTYKPPMKIKPLR